MDVAVPPPADGAAPAAQAGYGCVHLIAGVVACVLLDFLLGCLRGFLYVVAPLVAPLFALLFALRFFEFWEWLACATLSNVEFLRAMNDTLLVRLHASF